MSISYLPKNTNKVSFNQIDKILNIFVLLLIGFGLLFIEQSILKHFIFPTYFSINIIVTTKYSIIVYFCIFLKLVKNYRRKIVGMKSLIFFFLLYLVQFISYFVNTPINGLYNFFTQFIFGKTIGIQICILCYLYFSKTLTKGLPFFLLILIVINLFFMINISDKVNTLRRLYGYSGDIYSSGIYYYPGEIGMIASATFLLAFAEGSFIFTVLTLITSLFATFLTVERSPLIGIILGLIPVILYFILDKKRVIKTLIFVLFFIIVISFGVNLTLPENISNSMNTVISRFEFGSPGTNNQDTLLGGWNTRKDMFSNWEIISSEDPLFGKGENQVSEYIYANSAVGIGHNFLIKSSVTYGLLYLLILVIIFFRTFMGYWSTKNSKWGIAYFAAFISIFPSLLVHAFSPWCLWILFGIGIAAYDRNKIKKSNITTKPQKVVL